MNNLLEDAIDRYKSINESMTIGGIYTILDLEYTIKEGKTIKIVTSKRRNRKYKYGRPPNAFFRYFDNGYVWIELNMLNIIKELSDEMRIDYMSEREWVPKFFNDGHHKNKKFYKFKKDGMTKAEAAKVIKSRTPLSDEQLGTYLGFREEDFQDIDSIQIDTEIKYGGFDISFLDDNHMKKTKGQLLRVIDKLTKAFKSKGIEKYLYGDMRSSKKLSGRALGLYYPSQDMIQILATNKINEDDLFYTLVHELGHRVYYKNTPIMKYSGNEFSKISDDKKKQIEDQNPRLLNPEETEGNYVTQISKLPKNPSQDQVFIWKLVKAPKRYKDKMRIKGFDKEGNNITNYYASYRDLEKYFDLSFFEWMDDVKGILSWHSSDTIKKGEKVCAFYPSEYGRKNQSEWFAEAFVLWLLDGYTDDCGLKKDFDRMIK